MMTYNEGKKGKSPKEERETKRENYGGHCHNVLPSHLGEKRRIGPCGLTRIVDFKVLSYYSKNYLFQNP
jgi:hypothetical protein